MPHRLSPIDLWCSLPGSGKRFLSAYGIVIVLSPLLALGIIKLIEKTCWDNCVAFTVTSFVWEWLFVLSGLIGFPLLGLFFILAGVWLKSSRRKMADWLKVRMTAR